jgi:hydrogenase maturation protease
MPLILFLGNSLYAEDRIGLLVGEILKGRLEAEGFEVEILERIGYSLIDYIAGKDSVIIVDSIVGEYGEVKLIEDLKSFAAFSPKSPHYAGLPEAIELIKALNLPIPERILVLGIGVRDPYSIGEIPPELNARVGDIAEKVHREIRNVFN